MKFLEATICFIVTLLYLLFAGIFGWAMGSGPVKGFNSEEVQQIVTRKHDPGQNRIAKEDGLTATFAAGDWSHYSAGECSHVSRLCRLLLGRAAELPARAGRGEQHGGVHRRLQATPHLQRGVLGPNR